MSDIVLKVEGLYKQYRLGVIGATTLRDDISRAWAHMSGKDDPALLNSNKKRDRNELIWALQDVNFEINRGDVVGIIGKNGAGKSTLLKILSKVTAPTKGEIKIKGPISALLEVGTGFHPELTGRENIFLNGAILGMTTSEVNKKLDEIIDFSGVEKYIDTPVKRYSSGMYVRLAFAVAAHLEPKILIVDEVLAVGDAEFQKKCLGKMKDVAGQGRTVLFVSHNMGAVRSLCNKGLLLSNGQVKYYGETDSVIHNYLKNQLAKSKIEFTDKDKDASNELAQINSIEVLDGENDGSFWISKPMFIKIKFTNKSLNGLININLFFNSDEGINIFATCSDQKKLPIGNLEVVCKIPSHFLNDNSYYIDLMLVEDGKEAKLFLKDVMLLEGKEPARKEGWMEKFPGLVRPNFEWEFNIL
jgi:lipopolysaccharide transport system ATP-binding protein